MKPVIVLACLIFTALAVPAHAQQGNARMYKCVDNAGKVYYSDKMNPDCGQGTELNRQGVVMKKKEVAKPGKPASAGESADVDKSLKAQQRRDRALMATYTTEEEIDAARDRSLAIPAQGTKTTETKLDKANQKLTELKKQADAGPLAGRCRREPEGYRHAGSRSRAAQGAIRCDPCQVRSRQAAFSRVAWRQPGSKVSLVSPASSSVFH
jgi:hypothetical protein